MASSEEERCGGGRQSRRTRSQAAPDWTVHETLTLVSEIAAVEGECSTTVSSFQKWKIVAENCNSTGVNRTLNQCRRKWDSLLTHYKKIKHWESSSSEELESYWSLDRETRRGLGFPEEFDSEVFKAIDDHLKDEGNGSDTDTDRDNDPEALADEVDVLVPACSGIFVYACLYFRCVSICVYHCVICLCVIANLPCPFIFNSSLLGSE